MTARKRPIVPLEIKWTHCPNCQAWQAIVPDHWTDSAMLNECQYCKDKGVKK